MEIKKVNQIIKDNSYMFIPFNFIENDWVDFKDIEKPEHEFKYTTILYKTICFIFGLKDEEKKLAHECINYDLLTSCGTNTFEMFYKTGKMYGIKGEEMFICFHFFMNGRNPYELDRYEGVENLCKMYKERIRREYTSKEYLTFLFRLFPDKEKKAFITDKIENYFK